MAGKSNFHANLPILDGKNWDTWVKQMKVIFIVQEADEQVNTVLDPLPANATEQQRTTFREAQKKHSKALFLIHQCVNSKVFEKIADATTSKDAWDILHKSYGGDAKVKKVKLQALKRQFELLEMKSDEAVAEYFTRVETLTNQMKNCGSTLSEEEMVEKVVRTLTHKFDHIVVTIEQTKDLSEIKMEDLQSTLEAHELKHGERNHGKEDEQALFVKFKKYQDEKKKWQNKKGSKKGKESVEDKPESSKKEGGQKTKKDKSTIQCYNCNKHGHYASECKAPKKKKSQDTEEEANVAQDGSTSEDDVSFMVTITDETTESMVWYFDTGCSNHMTGNKSILTDFNKRLNKRIKLANGNFIAAEGMRNVVIQRSNGKKAVIEKVLYVPGMKCNLMSVGQLLEKCFKAVFEGETLKLFDSKQRLILKTAQSQNRTFKTQVKTIEVECLATSTEDKDRDLWHRNICGPIDVLSTGGNKYFITFVDEYSSDDDNRSHMTENDNGSDQGPLLMMPTTEDEFGKQEGRYLDTCCSNHMTSNKEWLVNYDSSKKSTIRFADSRTVKSEGIGDMLIKGKDGNQVLITGVMYMPSNILSIEQLVEKDGILCIIITSRTVQVKFENSNSEVLIEEENDKSIKILRTGGASKHTSKESDSEHQKVHISEDVIMNEVHINEDSESDCNAETDVEAPEAEVSAVEANVETRAGSTKTRESDEEANVEASEVEVSAVEASVETEAISTRKRQVPARWQEYELANDSRVSKEGELMQCALLVDEPVTKSKAMTDVGIVPCFLRNKLLRTRGLMLHQKKYVGEILRRFNMVESTLEFGIFLPKSARNAKPEIKIVWFSDAEWCGEKVDRRSTSGYVFKFQNAPVSWCSKKQSVIALSSCEAEYVAGSLAACQANWLQSLLCEERSVPEAKKGDGNCQL
ncbi:hypothetical protein TSUD_55260 [Trifolium subterraneum]|uniref:CCHC-type domain-containing protein n=1 Tax=Trifolium subterraneum TaxID=3900 RepID=A0A2Z6MQB2_TRISU|nr:hypothetical protein TSUD_55260 [Trifolium subterraneum]